VSGPLRVAIAGTGNIARAHARALAAVAGAPGRPSAVLAAATDIDAERLGSFGSEFGVAGTYPTLDLMLSRARPALVHVCTPPGEHRAVALACLRAGASVLVEKPPAISLREFDEIAAAEGGDGGPWFATVFQHRFGAGQRRLRKLIAAGALGRPLLAVCHTTWFRDQAYFDVPWRGRWDTEGGGPTMGHGIHQMDMLLDALGDWTEVSALTRTQARRVETEDLSLAHVTFASGAVASVVNSVLSPREESCLRLDFERATVEVTHLYGYRDDDWRLTPAPGHGGQVTAAWRAAGNEGGSGGDGSAGSSGHADQLREVIAALRAGRRPPVTPARARQVMTLAAAIYASAAARRPVTPGDLAPGTPFYGAMNGRGPRG
jgi:predicted dehydrogenase